MKNPFFAIQACCFTGHRPNGLPTGSATGMLALQTRLSAAVRDAADAGATRFFAGGARGFDTMAAETVLRLAAERPEAGIALCLALPARRQTERWSAPDRDRYDRILSQAAEVWYADEFGAPDAAAMQSRNRYLVDHADACIAYCVQSGGGTAYTLRYAGEKGRIIVNLAEGYPS